MTYCTHITSKGKEKRVAILPLTPELDTMGASTFKVCESCERWIKLSPEERTRPPIPPAEVAAAVATRAESGDGGSGGSGGSGGAGSGKVDLSKLEPLFGACMVVNQKLCPVGNDLITRAKACEDHIHAFLVQEVHKKRDFDLLTAEFISIKDLLAKFTQSSKAMEAQLKSRPVPHKEAAVCRDNLARALLSRCQTTIESIARCTVRLGWLNEMVKAEGSIRDQAERLRRATLVKGMLLVTVVRGKDLGSQRRKASILVETSSDDFKHQTANVGMDGDGWYVTHSRHPPPSFSVHSLTS